MLLARANLKQRGKRAAGLLLASLMLLAGCRPPTASDQAPLVIAAYGSIDSVDPAQATTVIALQLISALGDPLYAIDGQGAIQPKLARALPRLSDDGLTATIPLRQGVLFHDGTPFDADAMAFSLRRFLAIGKLSYVVGDRISAVRVTGPYELQLDLRRPFSPLAKLLSFASLTPISPTAYANYEAGFRPNAFVGTGPYELRLQSPQLQRLEPFAQYWGEAPRNDGIALVGMSTSTSLYGAISSGNVDVLLSTSLEPEQQSALHQQANQGQLREGAGPALGIGYITLLTDRPPLDNQTLRRALAFSLDRELLTKRVTDKLRPPLRGLVPPKLPGALAAWPRADASRARQLLQQEGYCSGEVLPLQLTYRSNVPTDRLLALSWQEWLRSRLGDCVRLDLTGMESTTAYRQLGDGAFQMILLDWMGDYPDADNYLTPLLGCTQSEGNRCLEGDSASGGSFWTAPGLEEKLRLSNERRGQARLDLLDAVQREAANGVPYLPMWQTRPRAWARNSIT
ncbi:MAG TPA: ABC transporter substrate-binding protein, partial [Synechococcales bacterium UBA12195]|nr:ABC transporter substrate-binding protein [Synechococcales bacterium UBA12195]